MAYSITEQELQALKSKHGEVYRYLVKDDNGNEVAACYLREVTLDDIEYADSVSRGKFSFKRNILQAIYLCGDDAMLNNKKYSLGLINHVSELIDIELGTLEKL
ncbi:MAG: hypothetical protein SNJ71_00140 [Bacteroidales bacterium]